METPGSISQWANQNFGLASSNFRIVVRANEEMSELLKAVSTGQPTKKILEEVADVAIVMYRYTENIHMKIDYAEIQLVHPSVTEYLIAQANTRLAAIIRMVSLWEEDSYTKYTINELYWILRQICVSLRSSLQYEVDSKMAINRQRKWILDGTGQAQHIVEG